MLNVLGSGVQPGWNGKISNYDQTLDKGYNGSDGTDNRRTIAWRHKQGANILFFDGHVAWTHKTDIYHMNGNTIVQNDRLWKVME